MGLMSALLALFGGAFDDVSNYAGRRHRAACELKRFPQAYVIFVQADLGEEPPISLYSKLGAHEHVP